MSTRDEHEGEEVRFDMVFVDRERFRRLLRSFSAASRVSMGGWWPARSTVLASACGVCRRAAEKVTPFLDFDDADAVFSPMSRRRCV